MRIDFFYPIYQELDQARRKLVGKKKGGTPMKKLLTLVLALAMVMTMFVMPVAAESEYPDELTVFCGLSEHISKVGVQNLNEAYIFQEVERITGTKVNFIHPAAGSDVPAQINLMVASGDLPDIIVNSNWKFSSDRCKWQSVLVSLWLSTTERLTTTA